MNWDKVKSWSIGTACAMILVVHTPPVLTDPLKNAVSQMRQGYANSEPQSEDSMSTSDVVSKIVKKILK